MAPRIAFYVLVLSLLAFSGVSRFVREQSNLISDGVDGNDHDHQLLTTNIDENSTAAAGVVELRGLQSTTVTCTPAYGFLPCTTEVWGELFLIVVYEYLLSLAQKYVTQGSELFFKLFGTGIFGASVFQILGTIPQIVILLVNGLAGSTSTAEGLTTMGLAMLAGSTTMSLTLLWGSIIAFGSSDLSQVSSSSSSLSTTQTSTTAVASNTSTTATTQTSSNSGASASSTAQTSTTTASATPSTTTGTQTPFSLTGYGVTTDDDTSFIAKIMLASMIPFLILQLPQILDSTTGTEIAIIVAWALSLVALLVYCIYQVFQPLIQKRRLDYILLKFIRDRLQQSLVQPSGEPDEQAIEALFKKIDKDNDGSISKTELEAMFLGIKIKEVGLTEEDYVSEVMENFDLSDDGKISKTEFVKGMSLWLREADSGSANIINRLPSSDASRIEEEEALLHSKKQKQIKEKEKQKQKTSAKTWLSYLEAAYFIILGTAIMVLLAQPLMEAIEDFSSAVNIPSFIITYIIVPLSMSYRQAIQAIASAKQKTEKAISLTFSMIYTSVFMNNMMGLTMFLLIVYVRDLSWDVSAGVLIVLVVGVVMGVLASFRTKFPYWICILAFLLYPVSLVVMYVLITYCGWST